MFDLVRSHQDFEVRIKYRTELPPIPSEPSFLRYPLSEDSLWGWRTCDLEGVPILHSEPFGAAPVNLIDLHSYEMPGLPVRMSLNRVAKHVPEDDVLLVERQTSKSDALIKDATWFEKSEYTQSFTAAKETLKTPFSSHPLA